MRPRDNRRPKAAQKNPECKEPLSSQFVLKMAQSLWQKMIAQAPPITDSKLIEVALFSEKELALATLQCLGEAVITTDTSSQITQCNSAAERLLGWTINQIRGLPSGEILRLFDEVTGEAVENPIDKVLQQKQIIRLENSLTFVARDEKEYAINLTASPICSGEGQLMGVVVIISDHSQARQLTRQLSWQASHDPLTGLVNRQVFEQRVEKALENVKSQNMTHTLGYLDLDKFKMINDSCGHVAGDHLLRQISFLLQQQIRSSDTIARLGGDEFGLLLLNCPIEEGKKIAETLRQALEDFRFIWEQQRFSIGASIGLVPIDAESADVTTLLDTADTACYVAKSRGRNRIHTFSLDEEELNQQGQARLWVSRLNQALENNKFCLYTQRIAPITSAIGTNHYEVLLRLVDEQGNMILPGNFLPVAERYHLMPMIDQWVIKNFFNHYAQHNKTSCFQTARQENIVYNINLSAVSLNNQEFLDFLRQQLACPPIPPQSLCFEITESSALANFSQAKLFMDTLKQLGCRLALDNVGTGINSLTYLKNLSVDYLKINMSLITDAVDYTFVECFNRIGHALGMQTIAEFVEHPGILEPLKSMGIDYVQGYSIAEPVPLCFTNIFNLR
ncbi:EAL domain-containing protein [Gloeothece verrucosa]|uniref:Diguanylate cyclase/phosphodiesterase with PAS/PAC sensor(S) n=1 Tax=Gloeothece verrucosa (strain PCC 7822) TaxID=497965 RepID=E0UJ13_GLOV7|nr:EAL domain-containing protein [Gloeothece verrucosa]ADN14593.1 diguanylate cyclase/phosphodiesterase with PAS/PAC sensor(s) [Gloeothece verrucosa PCC 7822]